MLKLCRKGGICMDIHFGHQSVKTFWIYTISCAPHSRMNVIPVRPEDRPVCTEWVPIIVTLVQIVSKSLALSMVCYAIWYCPKNDLLVLFVTKSLAYNIHWHWLNLTLNMEWKCVSWIYSPREWRLFRQMWHIWRGCGTLVILLVNIWSSTYCAW